MEKNILKIASELTITPEQVQSVVSLLLAGSTIPFIARYRKEVTGSLDEVVLAAIRDQYDQLMELDKRRETILKSIEKQGKLTPALAKAIDTAESLTELEDIYLPYKPKRKTRASMAKEKGLEPLALTIFEQRNVNLEKLTSEFINAELGVNTGEEALEGARDIMAEWVSENQEARQKVRELFWSEGVVETSVVKSKAQDTEAQKFKDYFEWKESIKKVPSHRLLAMRRAEKEGFVTMDIAPTEELAIQTLEKQFVRSDSAAAAQGAIGNNRFIQEIVKAFTRNRNAS
jgi:uncharacterized protein